jgi:hypothetical protein
MMKNLILYFGYLSFVLIALANCFPILQDDPTSALDSKHGVKQELSHSEAPSDHVTNILNEVSLHFSIQQIQKRILNL